MLMKPHIPINKVFCFLIHQERQHIRHVAYDKIIAFMIKFPYKPRQNESTTKPFYMGHGRGIKICTYCQKLGHTINVWFKKHGLSPYLRKTNVAQLYSSEDTKDDNTTSTTEDEPITTSSSGFTIEKQKFIFSLIQQSSTTYQTNMHHIHNSINMNPYNTLILLLFLVTNLLIRF